MKQQGAGLKPSTFEPEVRLAIDFLGWVSVQHFEISADDIRKVAQVLEQTAREILTLFQSVHQPSGFKEVPSKCAKAKELFCTVRTQLGELKNKFPVEQYYRFHEHWRFVLQRLAFLAAFEVYLEIEVVRKKEFHLDVEDYLAGVLIMASELSRLAVNSITAGDYGRPLRISKELDSGFRLLNLKNDPLRKRYDDLSIRGLTKE
uniref:translin-like n=1 Tax=Oncorhynchus gorbuscha TaxID=8017 RepID=UPI001EAEBEF2|nr:translin-like [Oncorhynchus gorbuscha]